MGHKFCVHPGVYLLAAFAVLILPLRWWMGAVLAALAHEFSHIAAARLFGSRILEIRLSPTGAVIASEPIEGRRGVLASAAGPLGSLLLSLFIRGYPELAICGLIQGVFNLLPVYPLDGGRIVRCLLPAKFCTVLETMTIWASGLLGMGLYETSCLGISSFLPLAALVAIRVPRKLTCKESNLAVQ